MCECMTELAVHTWPNLDALLDATKGLEAKVGSVFLGQECRKTIALRGEVGADLGAALGAVGMRLRRMRH